MTTESTTQPLRPRLDRRHVPALLVAAVGCLVYLIWRPPSNDLAVQELRIALFRKAPYAIWNNQWFGGHHTPAYSLLSPLLGSIFGAVWLGVLCALVAAFIGSEVVHRVAAANTGLRRRQLAAVLFAIGCLSSLYGGRITFLLGVTIGVWAVLSALGDRVLPTIVLSLLSAMGSPVAGLFVSVIGCAVVCSGALDRRQGWAMAIAPLVPAVGLTVLFPEGGDFPFPFGGLVNVLIVCGALAVVGWRYQFIRWVTIGYAAFCVLCAIPQTPIGGNAARLAALAGPAALVMVLTWSNVIVAVALVPLMVLQWSPVSLPFHVDIQQDDDEFFEPLLEVLRERDPAFRVEVVPLATHGEADVVALEFPIARGWSRQLDRKFNPMFYEDPDEVALDPQDYLDWLVQHGVSVVAIADTDLDSSGLMEAELLSHPPEYLHLIHADPVWRVYEVDGSQGLTDGRALVTDLGVSSFTLRVVTPGDIGVRVRFSPWFRVTNGDACVEDDGTGWTMVHAATRGTIRVSAVISPSTLLDRDGDC